MAFNRKDRKWISIFQSVLGLFQEVNVEVMEDLQTGIIKFRFDNGRSLFQRRRAHFFNTRALAFEYRTHQVDPPEVLNSVSLQKIHDNTGSSPHLTPSIIIGKSGVDPVQIGPRVQLSGKVDYVHITKGSDAY